MSNSVTTTELMPPIHPGEILLEEFLRPLGMSQYALAKAIGVPPRRINEIVQGKRAITADTGLRLSRFFDLSPEFFLRLQLKYDVDVAQDRLAGSLERDIKPLRRAG